MQYSSLFGLAAFLALANANPIPTTAVVYFNGAAGAQYSLTVPLDGSITYTHNVLSISSVSSTIDIGSLCTLKTVDYPPALVQGPPGTWVVGPPQTVISISCNSPTPPTPKTISIEFDGANPSQDNALSISTLVSTYAGLPTKCHFDYVNYRAALVLIRPNTWAVGPPQTIKSVTCTA